MLALVLLAHPAAAQGRLVRADLRADLDERRETVEVRLAYSLRPPEGASAVPLSLLRPASATVEGVTAAVQGREVPLELRGEGAAARGELSLPAGAAGREVRVELLYRVRRPAEGSRVLVPLVAVLWPPVEALPRTFSAEVRLPAGLSAYSPFPSSLRPAGGAGEGLYRADLPVLPAMLAFDVAAGDPPLLTLPAVLNLLAVGSVLVLGGVGWRRLKVRP